MILHGFITLLCCSYSCNTCSGAKLRNEYDLTYWLITLKSFIWRQLLETNDSATNRSFNSSTLHSSQTGSIDIASNILDICTHTQTFPINNKIGLDYLAIGLWFVLYTFVDDIEFLRIFFFNDLSVSILESLHINAFNIRIYRSRKKLGKT